MSNKKVNIPVVISHRKQLEELKYEPAPAEAAPTQQFDVEYLPSSSRHRKIEEQAKPVEQKEDLPLKYTQEDVDRLLLQVQDSLLVVPEEMGIGVMRTLILLNATKDGWFDLYKYSKKFGLTMTWVNQVAQYIKTRPRYFEVLHSSNGTIIKLKV